jgi:acetyltransferase-like isoleucine patch superfamily enzyme
MHASLRSKSEIPASIYVPIMQTDLEIKPVKIGARSEIGTNGVILPGVAIIMLKS